MSEHKFTVPKEMLQATTEGNFKNSVVMGADQIPGEVLVPASRFIPKCEHQEPEIARWFDTYGESLILRVKVHCGRCYADYEQELPTGVPGIPSGNRTV